MRKVICVVLLICTCVCSAILFSSCNKADDGYVLPESVEVDSITLRLREAKTDIVLQGVELDEAVSLLRSQPRLDDEALYLPVGKEKLTRTSDYTLEITTKKKLFKKAKTYTVSFGGTTSYTNVFGVKTVTQVQDQIRMTGHIGTADTELLKFVVRLVEREDAAYSASVYDSIKNVLTESGFTISDVEFSESLANKDFMLHASLDVKGFTASNEQRSSSVRVILCKSVEDAENRTKSTVNGRMIGISQARIFYYVAAPAEYVVETQTAIRDCF